MLQIFITLILTNILGVVYDFSEKLNTKKKSYVLHSDKFGFILMILFRSIILPIFFLKFCIFCLSNRIFKEAFLSFYKAISVLLFVIITYLIVGLFI